MSFVNYRQPSKKSACFPIHGPVKFQDKRVWTCINCLYDDIAAKLKTSRGVHNDPKYGKSIMMSHEISDRDKGAKMLII